MERLPLEKNRCLRPKANKDLRPARSYMSSLEVNAAMSLEKSLTNTLIHHAMATALFKVCSDFSVYLSRPVICRYDHPLLPEILLIWLPGHDTFWVFLQHHSCFFSDLMIESFSFSHLYSAGFSRAQISSLFDLLLSRQQLHLDV